MPLQTTIREDFLYYIWTTRSFDILHCKTVDGKPVVIHDFGIRNHDAGPDFSSCKVEIDGVLWAGNVEMHVITSDWDRHGHDLDPAYANVILHVVYEHDRAVIDIHDRTCPILELKDYIDPTKIDAYLAIMQQQHDVLCHQHFASVSELSRSMWTEKLAVTRVERKSKAVLHLVERLNGDWQQVLYIMLCRYLGGKPNQLPFEMLAESLPYRILLKHRDNITSIESLLYGQAGMLDVAIEDDYHVMLRKEYTFLKSKYRLSPISVQSWKFAKMRPASFPTIRIAQLAQLTVMAGAHLFDRLVVSGDLRCLSVSTSPYWRTHYTFAKESSVSKDKNIGAVLIDSIAINVVAPMLFAYGIANDEQGHKDAALEILESLKPENNRITKKYSTLGAIMPDALSTQGYLEMYTQLCSQKKCMSCTIGHKLMTVK